MYLPPTKRVPFAEPKVLMQTAMGMRNARAPRARLPNVFHPKENQSTSYQTVTVTLTVKDTHFAINQLCFGTKQLVFDFNAKKKTLTALGFDPGPIR